jgi:hypothetical protein
VQCRDPAFGAIADVEHDWQVGPPFALKVPGAQGVQLVLAEFAANVPPAHAAHAEEPGVALYVPGAQVVQGETPPTPTEPAAHWVGGTLWPFRFHPQH